MGPIDFHSMGKKILWKSMGQNDDRISIFGWTIPLTNQQEEGTNTGVI